MLPDRVSNPGPLTYESGALPIALRGLANLSLKIMYGMRSHIGIQNHSFIPDKYMQSEMELHCLPSHCFQNS